MLTVPMLLEQVARGMAAPFVPLLGRFASIEGPFRLGLPTTVLAARRLGDTVCEMGIRLAADYIGHVRQNEDVRAGETWKQ